MPRFNQKRAAAFAEYAVTALVRDAKADGKLFVRVARSELAEALDTRKLYDAHVEEVRLHLVGQGIGMANLGHEFVFFDAGLKGRSHEPGAEVLNHVTEAFLRVYPSDAADELWSEGGYMPDDAPKAAPRRAAAKAAKAPATVRAR